MQDIFVEDFESELFTTAFKKYFCEISTSSRNWKMLFRQMNAEKDTTKAIMRAGLWWPTFFQDVTLYVKGCDVCQHTKAPIRRDEMPLRPMMGARAFAKWGIDFVGSIHPGAMHTHAEYIIVATDYVTKWVEAKATIKNDARTTAKI